jgi:hypothetical protein
MDTVSLVTETELQTAPLPLINGPATEAWDTLKKLSDAGFDSRWGQLARRPDVAKIIVRLLGEHFVFTEEQAIGILGRPNVLTIDDGMRAFWHARPDEFPLALRFFRSTLQKCADENTRGAEWHLVYPHKVSFMELWDASAATGSYLSERNKWWAEGHAFDREWASRRPLSKDYCLIDLQPRFVGEPQPNVLSLGHGLLYASNLIVAHAAIIAARVHGKKVLAGAVHRGHDTLTSFNRWVSVDSAGGDLPLTLDSYSSNKGIRNVGLCVARPFDF